MFERKFEVWVKQKLEHNKVISLAPPILYPQERDWTCFIGSLRTILSGLTSTVPTENELIDKLNLIPNPYFSKDIKKWDLLSTYDVIYGCDNKDITFDDILDYYVNEYFIMLECMINYSHWMVLLGYYPLNNNEIEMSKLLLYDPYYDEVRLMNTDEFISMWADGNHNDNKIEKDFIAIKSKSIK